MWAFIEISIGQAMKKIIPGQLDFFRAANARLEPGNSRTYVRCRMFRIITFSFGMVWLLDAAIQAHAWLFASHGMASSNLLAAFASAQRHAPTWLKPLLTSTIHGVRTASPTTVAVLMVVIAATLGITLIIQRWLGLIAVFGVAYSLVCWVLLEAIGFPYANGQTDPGVFIPYAITFIFVLSIYLPHSNSASAPSTYRPALWDAARIAFGLLWAFDAALKWFPAFMFHFSSQITGVIPGQPQWVADWLQIVADMIAIIGPVLSAVIVAIVETAIALGLLANRFMGLVLPVGIAYSLIVWTTAEAFGGPYTSAGTGVRGNVIGNVIIYIIPFLFLSADFYTRRARIVSEPLNRLKSVASSYGYKSD